MDSDAVALTFSLIFTSCGDKDDKVDEPDSSETIIGKWVHKNISYGCDFYIYFGKDGSGWMEWSGEDDGEDERMDFVYQVYRNHIYFSDEYNDWECEYEFSDKSLIVHGNLWGEDDDISLHVLQRTK